MKHIKLPELTGDIYPVGGYMDTAKQYIKFILVSINPLLIDKKINLWVRGSSGAILGALFCAYSDNKNIIISHVKKTNEHTHSWHTPYYENGINIILDDFSISGETVNFIYEKMVGLGITKVDFLILDHLGGSFTNCRIDFLPETIVYNGLKGLEEGKFKTQFLDSI